MHEVSKQSGGNGRAHEARDAGETRERALDAALLVGADVPGNQSLHGRARDSAKRTENENHIDHPAFGGEAVSGIRERANGEAEDGGFSFPDAADDDAREAALNDHRHDAYHRE